MMNTVPQIIIDTDPGQDDAAAILMALGLEALGLCRVLALTCVAGNVGVALTSENARIIADWAGREDLPVYAGAAHPLLNSLVTAEEVHGKNGLDGCTRHPPRTPLQSEPAAEFLVRTLREAPPQSITLCPIGPLTNLAHAFALAPDCLAGIREICLMGGAYFEAGNISPAAEFNFYVDPHAAALVLQRAQAHGVKVTVLPLDVTHKACITTPRMQKLRDLPNQNGRRLADILHSYERFDTRKFGLEGGPLHDPCAIAAAVFPELFHGKYCPVAVETQGSLTQGAAVVDWWSTPQGADRHPENTAGGQVKWVTGLNAEAFFERLTQAIAALP